MNNDKKIIWWATCALLASAAGLSFFMPKVATVQSAKAYPPSNIVRLNGVVRDFKSTHGDFDAAQSEGPGHVAGMVDVTLGADGLPMYDGGGNLVTAQAKDQSQNNIAPVLANAANAKAVDFDIVGGKVIPSESFVAKLTVLGAAMENSSIPFRVTVRMKVGTSVIDPFGAFASATAGGNVHDNSNPREYIMSTPMPAGTAMSVTGRSWAQQSGSWQQYFNVDSVTGATGPGTSGSGGGMTMVKVLRDGDSVPNIEPFGNQADIASFLNGYINPVAKKVTIADNQAIFLFELATYDPDQDYYDFQDLVTLITMAKTPDGFAPNPAIPMCGPTNDTNATLGATSTAGVTDANTFREWFSDSLGKNVSAIAPLDLVHKSNGNYVFDDQTDTRYSALGGFYPADGRLLGDEGSSGHNEDFTYQFEAHFTYDAMTPQFFEALSDAEIWVFIDDTLVIDMGGFHGVQKQRIDLSRLCLEDGKTYKLSFFMANRNVTQSRLRLETNLNFTGEMQPSVFAPVD